MEEDHEANLAGFSALFKNVDNKGLVDKKLKKMLGNKAGNISFSKLSGQVVEDLYAADVSQGQIKSLQMQKYLEDDEQLANLMLSFHKKSEQTLEE